MGLTKSADPIATYQGFINNIIAIIALTIYAISSIIAYMSNKG